MRKLQIVLLLAVILPLSACGLRTTGMLLADVESYLQERPDSAFSVLKAVDTTSLRTKSLRAKYALLYAIALDKCVIDTTDIGIIRPAMDYYGGKDDSPYRSKTWYYAGRIFTNGKEYPDALLAYGRALETLDSLDYYFAGLVYSGITDVYNKTYNRAEELSNARQAYHCFTMMGEKKHRDLAVYKLAQAYHNNSYFEEADSLYTSIFANADSTSKLARYAIREVVTNSVQSGEPDVKRGIELLEYLVSHGWGLSIASYYEYVYLLLLDGKNKDAESLLLQLEPLTDVTDVKALEVKYRILLVKGDNAEAIKLLETQLAYQNQVVEEQLAQSVFKAQSNYYRLTSDMARQKTTIANQRSLLVFVISAIVICLLYIGFRLRRDRLVKERERLALAVEESQRLLQLVQKEATEGKEDSAREHAKLQEVRKSYVTLFQKRFREIGKYYDASAAHRMKIVEERAGKDALASLKSLLEDISGKSEGQKQFENRINADIENVIMKIREDFPGFDNDDIRFICYMVVGFDNPAIAFLMDMTKENVRVKRHRIRKKLKEYEGPNEMLYQLFV